MSQRCTICHHEQRQAIDRLLVGATSSNRRIATQHGLSEAAVRRHKSEHLPTLLTLARRDEQSTHELDLAILLRGLFADARRIQERAEQAGDYRAALAGIRELRGLIELAITTGEVTPEPAQGRTVTVIWHMGDDDELPRSEQPAAARLGPSPSSAAPRVAAPNGDNLSGLAPLDNNARAESQSKPRVRRRQYSG